jgi:hypothetical protein
MNLIAWCIPPKKNQSDQWLISKNYQSKFSLTFSIFSTVIMYSRLFQISTFIFNVFSLVHIFRSSSQSHSCQNRYSKIDLYISVQTFIELSHYNYQNHSSSNIFSNHFPLIHHSNVSKCWHWVILSQTMSYQFSLDLSYYLDFSL